MARAPPRVQAMCSQRQAVLPRSCAWRCIPRLIARLRVFAMPSTRWREETHSLLQARRLLLRVPRCMPTAAHALAQRKRAWASLRALPVPCADSACEPGGCGDALTAENVAAAAACAVTSGAVAGSARRLPLLLIASPAAGSDGDCADISAGTAEMGNTALAEAGNPASASSAPSEDSELPATTRKQPRDVLEIMDAHWTRSAPDPAGMRADHVPATSSVARRGLAAVG